MRIKRLLIKLQKWGGSDGFYQKLGCYYKAKYYSLSGLDVSKADCNKNFQSAQDNLSEAAGLASSYTKKDD